MRSLNPFLPKRAKSQSIRWRTGPSAGKTGIVIEPASPVPVQTIAPAPDVDYRKDPRGRKPKLCAGEKPAPRADESRDPARPRYFSPPSYPDAGKIDFCSGGLHGRSVASWASALDMIPLDHGPVGCGAYGQSLRLRAPGFAQGIESFSALHFCTDLRADDLEDGGDERLRRAMSEAVELFPLARGFAVTSEDPVALLDSNVKGIAKIEMRRTQRLVLPLDTYKSWAVETAAALQSASRIFSRPSSKKMHVALPYAREAPALVWIVSKLLADMGIETVHEITQSSSLDLARMKDCRFIIGFAGAVDVMDEDMRGGYADLLRQWLSTPIIWTCFESPSMTTASLRAIGERLDRRTARRAEQTIARGEALVRATIERYRPRLRNKLMLHFRPMTETQLEPYRLLGLRIGDASGWIGKTGKRRTPRLRCDADHPDEAAIDSYLAEAKPDLVLHFGDGESRGEYEWRKRAQVALPFSPFFDRKGNAFWGYDGFACLAEALDKATNATWRRIVATPWKQRA
ncbi:nitrogenase [Methylosinus sp. 3S-1]|nr:nitrogenase [Methylosinus sp. 3S-1]